MQGCWGDESSLMMLPNMTPEAIPQLASKGFQAVPQLCQAASENAAKLRSLLASVLGGSREASETMQVGANADSPSNSSIQFLLQFIHPMRSSKVISFASKHSAQ